MGWMSEAGPIPMPVKFVLGHFKNLIELSPFDSAE
jgi:hypothetical protein